MKIPSKLILGLFFSILFASCDSGSLSDADPMKPVDEVEVVGPVSVIRSGTLTPQSSTNTKGMIQIVSNEEGKFFVRLTDDFTTKFSTGTVTVYLSTSENLRLSSAGSFQLISIVGKSGEHFFPLASSPEAKFTHGIIWCGAAAIPFGFAPLD